MASFFRRKISQKFVTAFDDLPYTSKLLIPSFVKVSNKKNKEPQLLLPFHKLKQILPDSGANVDFTNILRTMRNQGLPTAEGIIDIRIEEQGPHSFAFVIDKHIFSKIILLDICLHLSDIPKNSCLLQNLPRKNIALQYKSPTIGHMFTMEDFQYLIHHNFVANISKFLGMNVTHINHVEDWGPLWDVLLAGYSQFGVEEELENNAIQHLSEISKAIFVKNRNDPSFQETVSTYSKKLRNGDQNVLKLWAKIKEKWWRDTRKIFTILDINFDITQFDSSLQNEIDNYSDILFEKELVDLESMTIMNVNVASSGGSSFQTVVKDAPGRPLYALARDIAFIIQQKEMFNFDSLYHIGNDNMKEYYEGIFQILDYLNFNWSRELLYIGIKEPKWTIQSLRKHLSVETVINKAKTQVIRELKMDISLETGDNTDEIAENLALSGIILNILRHKRTQEFTFDFDECVQLDQTNGIAFQFMHAGLLNIERESEIKFNFDIDLSPLGEPEAVNLIQHLAKFDEIILTSYIRFAPQYIVKYISILCNLANNAVDNLRLDIKEDKLRVIKARLLLYHATQKILHQCLKLLGVKPLDKI